jgi:hypothetical protein
LVVTVEECEDAVHVRLWDTGYAKPINLGFSWWGGKRCIEKFLLHQANQPSSPLINVHHDVQPIIACIMRIPMGLHSHVETIWQPLVLEAGKAVDAERNSNFVNVRAVHHVALLWRDEVEEAYNADGFNGDRVATDVIFFGDILSGSFIPCFVWARSIHADIWDALFMLLV